MTILDEESSSYYPKDLLGGLFPLVFAVNAIHDNGGGTNRLVLFETFLTALSESLVDEAHHPDATNTNTTDIIGKPHRPARTTMSSLFRSDDDNEELESSDDDYYADIMGGISNTSTNNNNTRRRVPGGFGFGGGGARRRSTSDHNDENAATSYAKALKNRQGFFQRARIVSVSSRYGFPPSKDPMGIENLASQLPSALKKRSTVEKEATVQALLEQYPVHGIIPSGWLEKHVHALPSAILVVCTVCGNQKQQAEQDALLYETIQHLQYSLVPKRQCSIQIVGLLNDDNLSDETGEEWSQAILDNVVLEENTISGSPVNLTILRSSVDLKKNNSSATTEAMRKLHVIVRDASLLYYLRQARRTKEKLHGMTHLRSGTSSNKRGTTTTTPMQLSPLLIRYCFKIAIFYEFQMKHEKSLRFLAEAYRHVAKYYQWLLAKNTPQQNDDTSSVLLLLSDTEEQRMSPSFGEMVGDSVEVELSSSSGGAAALWSKVVPPDDILYQCRAVADWLNLKLLSTGFASHTEGGLMAASNQWRQHSRVFCTTRHSSKLLPLVQMEEWLEWSYIARQRVSMSQLVERHPPMALGDLGNDFDEVVLRCSPWRTCESAAEAMLRLGRAVDQMRASGKYAVSEGRSESSSSVRARYVGGLSNEGHAADFQRECAVNHRSRALEFVLRAISMFERELEKEKRGFYAKDDFSERSSSRTGARLYYLAGGILLGMGRHEESAGHLTKAAKYSQGWRELELAVRQLLIECYEKYIPSQSESSESSQTALVSMILDSYFNAEMSSRDLRRALDHFATISGGDSLKWYHESTQEEDSSVPFSFAVSFPGKTHATSGDTVEASVLIKSNLDYAVHVNSASLITLAGKLSISAMDLLSATNASEGTEGGIIIQAKTAIIVTTKLDLPKDLSIIASDDSGNGGELQGVAGKGSFAKNAKPRTAGITAAGGARLVSEEKLPPGNSNAQGWNVRFLGGKPLLCDGLNLVFYPVQAERASGSPEKVTLIELTIEKKKKRTAANIKRTPFEEENYIASAWSRPLHLSFSRGPRSLRVLGPFPLLVVSDMTDDLTKGKALEGTVNRILLRLQAGPEERCSNMKCSVSCFSVLVTPSGSTKRLVSEEELTKETENSFDMKNPKYRTPVLVSSVSASAAHSIASDYGYDPPKGWKISGSGQKHNGMTLPALKGGESSFMYVDFYRPAAETQKEVLFNDGSFHDDDVADFSLCKTDFYVTLTYRQERPLLQKKQNRTRRSSRRRPVMSSSSAKGDTSDNTDTLLANEKIEDGETSEEVSLEYTGSVVWAPPISAKFRLSARKSCPCGSRHPSNRIDYTPQAGINEECILADGQSVCTRCSLQLNPSMDGLKTEIVAVRFADKTGPAAPLTVSLMSKDTSSGRDVVYESNADDRCRWLSKGSRFGVSYTVVARLKEQFKREGASSPLGSILVDWKPRPLDLPSEAYGSLDHINAHGPLALESPSTICFSGPPCYVESAPFEAKIVNIPCSLSVAVPFEVTYEINNLTSLHQMIKIELNETSPDGSSGLLLSGVAKGHLSLGPFARGIVRFSFVATKPGNVALPAFNIVSLRYGTWIVNDGPDSKRLFIFPR